jgi:parallel beta-helix repeat protein
MKFFFLKKCLIIGTIILLAGVISTSTLSAQQDRVINMTTFVWYETIQGAINNASPGDMLGVEPGTYNENVVVDRAVVIFGDLSKTQIVDGGSSGCTFRVTADGVTIKFLTIRNNGVYPGVKIESDGNFIYNNNIQNCHEGVYLYSGTSENTVKKNSISNSTAVGVLLSGSSTNLVNGNTITGNAQNAEMGVFVSGSSNGNTIRANTIQANNNGIYISSSSNNLIFHNNLINNIANARMLGSCPGTMWNDVYPTGGNYWSDHSGNDIYHGPNQNIPGSDFEYMGLGIIDNPYYIPYGGGANDRYPLTTQYNISNGF